MNSQKYVAKNGKNQNRLIIADIESPVPVSPAGWTLTPANADNVAMSTNSRPSLPAACLKTSAMAAVSLLMTGMAWTATTDADTPFSIGLKGGSGYATITNRLHPGNRIGCRFFEHTPLISGVPPAADAAPSPGNAVVPAFSKRPGVKKLSVPVTAEGWAPQRWTYYLAPATDGIDLLWVVETEATALNDYYGVQQCFRMSGHGNQEWRRVIAETPAFSEFDLWEAQGQEDKTSLTYVQRGGAWQPLPAVRETVGARTPLGVTVDTERSGGKLESMTEVGPYHAKMLDPVDTGLIARVDAAREWVCGLYWERTSHVTDHHPADCLHAIVNIGGVPPRSRRVLHGKIYWFKGSLEDLARHWKNDFPG